ncbi:MAG: SDR family oxidoreductase [Rhodospirillaceae bacterium]|nr:SDR family oxidoreductase [Rhodospirillaceae bacterium]
MTKSHRNILVTGGAGYVGAVLVPKLLAAGNHVTVLDLYLYGDDIFDGVRPHSGLREIKGDLRNAETVGQALSGCDTVIHLACISNDPSFELDPGLGKSINYDCFLPLVKGSKSAGVNRFIYASSSSVYGIKEGVEVSEDLALEPLTDYSRFKAMCEADLESERGPGFTTLTLRPATVCGYSPRQRLDVIVNILTNHAVHTKAIKVFGGDQLRPNIHIEDMTDLYVKCMEYSDDLIDGQVFNAGYENQSVMDLADTVKSVVGDVSVEVTPTDDHRSYHVSSEKIGKALGFRAGHTIEMAVQDLVAAFESGKLPNAMDDARYFNIKTMQAANLK